MRLVLPRCQHIQQKGIDYILPGGHGKQTSSTGQALALRGPGFYRRYAKPLPFSAAAQCTSSGGVIVSRQASWTGCLIEDRLCPH